MYISHFNQYRQAVGLSDQYCKNFRTIDQVLVRRKDVIIESSKIEDTTAGDKHDSQIGVARMF